MRKCLPFVIAIFLLLASCTSAKSPENTSAKAQKTASETGPVDTTADNAYSLPLSPEDAQKVLSLTKKKRKIVKIIGAKGYYFVISRSTQSRDNYPDYMGQIDCIRIADGVLVDNSVMPMDIDLPIAGYFILTDEENEAKIVFNLINTYSSSYVDGDNPLPLRLEVSVITDNSGRTLMYATDLSDLYEACWNPLEMDGYYSGSEGYSGSAFDEVCGGYDSITLLFGSTANMLPGDEKVHAPRIKYEYDGANSELTVYIYNLAENNVDEGDLGISNVFIDSASLEKDGSDAVVTVKLSEYAKYYKVSELGNLFSDKHDDRVYSRLAAVCVSFENEADNVPDKALYVEYTPVLN